MAKIIAQYTDEFSFLFEQLGMSAPPPPVQGKQAK
jgi:hypothetical protein